MSIINLFQQSSVSQCQLSISLSFPPETWSGACWCWDNSKRVTSPLSIPHTWIQALCVFVYFLLTAVLVDLFITAVLCGRALRLGENRKLPWEHGSTWGVWTHPPQSWWLCSLSCPPVQQHPHPFHASCACGWGPHLSMGWRAPRQGAGAAPATHQPFCLHCPGFLTVIIYYPLKWKVDCSVLNILFFFFNRVSLGHEYELCWSHTAVTWNILRWLHLGWNVQPKLIMLIVPFDELESGGNVSREESVGPDFIRPEVQRLNVDSPSHIPRLWPTSCEGWWSVNRLVSALSSWCRCSFKNERTSVFGVCPTPVMI